MSMNPDSKGSGCCGGSAKPTPQEAKQLAAQMAADAKAQKAVIPPPENPISPQPKSKSCCG